MKDQKRSEDIGKFMLKNSKKFNVVGSEVIIVFIY